MQSENNFIVTARKWRPLKFGDVVGQSHITVTLKNAIQTGRVHHAYLFSGPRGVGKTTTARILARALNCSNPKDFEPCNECLSCISIIEGRSLDVIEIDGASNNSVDDVRKLRENAKYPPVNGKYKMYIIDEVHMLSTSAFNALLKTLEEPPPHLLFVFATTEPHKVPATILSRCQRHSFKRMELETIKKHIEFIAKSEGMEIDEESLIAISKKADGSMRDAQSIFDQVRAFCGDKINYDTLLEALHLVDLDFFFRISKAIYEHNPEEMLEIVKEAVNKGYDIQECLGGMVEHFRNLLTVKLTNSSKLIEGSTAYLKKYEEEASKFTKADLLRLLNLITSTEQSIRFAPQPRIKFEVALVQMASLDSLLDISELLQEIRSLKGLPVSKQDTPKANKEAEKKTDRKEEVNYKTTDDSDSKAVVSEPLEIEKQESESINLPTYDFEVSDAEETKSDNNVILDTISADKISDGWEEFLEKYANSDNGLSMLSNKNLVLPTFYDSEIIFEVVSNFALENLEKKRLSIISALYEFYGAEIKCKILLGPPDKFETHEEEEAPKENIPSKTTGKKTSNKENKEKTSKSSLNKNKSNENKHPIENLLEDLFGAKEIQRKM
ncbi:MAG: DNA polymerase III subunit gamma/tau [Candidatus Kapabacteria bacterium]|nr:DNA polymerase III subunit gamma/tau [Candidatus Kapabacteria bacterium]